MTDTPPARRSIVISVIFAPLVLCLAALGFSYALATTSMPSASRAVAAVSGRSIDRPLRFTNPFLLKGVDPTFPAGGGVSGDPQGFDLGDTGASTNFVRYISAAGGFPPYSFQLKPLLGSQNNGVGGVGVAVPQLPNLSLSGRMTGVLPPGFLRFNIQLGDFASTQRVGTFRLNVVDLTQAGFQFRFGLDQLPRGQIGNDYFTRLGTVGGFGTVKYSVVPGSVNIAGTALDSLEDAGLSLGAEGTLFGRPIKAGDITFTAAAIDAFSTSALSRDRTQTNQKFTIKVDLLNEPISSQMAALNCAIGGNTKKTGADHFSYTGFLDPKGETLSTLAGTMFTLRAGSQPSSDKNPDGVLFSGTFDAAGKVANSAGKTVVTYSPSKGMISIKLTGVDIATNLGVSGFTNKTNQTVVLALELGEPVSNGVTKTAIRTCEVLRLATRTAASGSFSMNYTLAKTGYSRAGGFQIVNLVGSDVKISKTDSGDMWLVRFLAFPGQDEDVIPASSGSTGNSKKPAPTPTGFGQPPAASAALAALNDATILIGDSFSQDLPLSLLQVKLQFRATGKDPGVFRLRIDPTHYVHELITNAISSNDTGISAAIDTKDLTVFPFEMDASGANGATGRIMAPNRGQWTPR